MSIPSATGTSVSSDEAVTSPAKTLRRLFLTLFLRGRGARGLQKQTAPKSVGRKLFWSLALYALLGMLAAGFVNKPIFALSVYLHSMTFVFLGMFIASSAGEILFNKEEADILLHRPIRPQDLLWAKIRVLVEVSLWLAGAFNLVGFVVGAVRGGWGFVPAHMVSTLLEALFCVGFVVLAYELCLRWFGRERLDGLMTTTQVLIAVGAVLAGQILPRIESQIVTSGNLDQIPWWVSLLPPAWFAGFDDVLVGSGSAGSWSLAGVGAAATLLVLWLAFGRLASDYEAGLRALNETVSTRRSKRVAARRWIDSLIGVPPLRWWLRDPMSRAAFLLTGAYLMRDRDVKLRVYPGLAPFMAMPIIFLLPTHSGPENGSTFGIAFAGAYLGLTPMLGLTMLRYSQQWQAADIFRMSPIAGPAPICHGARRAVFCFLTLPVLAVFVALAFFTQGNYASLLLLLPGIIASPVFALVACLDGIVPLSLPIDAAKAAGRGVVMIFMMMLCLGLGALSAFSWTIGFFQWLLLTELIIAICVYFILRFAVERLRWKSLE